MIIIRSPMADGGHATLLDAPTLLGRPDRLFL